MQYYHASFHWNIKIFREKLQKRFCTFSSILALDFLKTLFLFDPILLPVYFLCLICDFIGYTLHGIKFYDKIYFRLLFLKIFRFSENCQYLTFGWFIFLWTIRPFKQPTSCNNIAQWSTWSKNKFLWAKSRHFWTKFNIFWFLTPQPGQKSIKEWFNQDLD